MLGAWLPWITLYAGLQKYGGLIGLYGRVVFAGGAVALGASALGLRLSPKWLPRGVAVVGIGLAGFIGWLLLGLVGTLRHGLGPMLIPRAGPGLFVSLVGAALIVLGPLSVEWRRYRSEGG